jgi:hypothetical protein
MPKFLIEVPHEEETVACARAVQVLFSTGSHFLSHAQFGCLDGDHRSWLTVDVDSKDEARRIVPPVFRSIARVVQLNSFTVDEIEEFLRHHQS